MAEELTFEQIVEINGKTGAPGKLINEGNLRFIIASVKNARTAADKATTLLYEIINLHPFLDGNKRTAYTATETFLNLNGKVVKPEFTEEYLEKLIYDIAIGKLNKQEVKGHIKKMIE